MELRTKKILLIIAFLGSVFLIGFLLYLLFFKPPEAGVDEFYQPPITETFPPSGPGTGIPIVGTGGGVLPGAGTVEEGEEGDRPTTIATGGLTKVQSIVDKPTKNAKMASNGKDIAYYDISDNSFYKIGATGRIEKISDKKFFNVEKTYWSNDINKAVIEYPDKTKIMYDFEKEQQFTIPKHWEGFDFSPDGEQIVTKSMGIDPDTRWLAISNADGSQAKRIKSLGENGDNVNPTWSPSNQIIATYTESSDLNRQSVYFIGKNDENFKAAVIEGRGFESTWSPTGSHLLYSVYNSESGYRPTLWITEANGERIGAGRKPLEINTWAHKCNFSSSTKVYCAVPTNLEEGSGIFPEVANSTPDNLYEIDLSTGTQKRIAVPERDTTIQNIMVSGDGNSLYYTDANNGQIFQIKIK